MDFTFSSEADDAAELAAQIVADRCTPERLQSVEREPGDRFDATLWTALADAGLLSLALPERLGGAGLGILEQARVVVEAGRLVAPVPLPTHLAALSLLAEVGGSDALVAEAANGARLLTVAHAEPGTHAPHAPSVAAVASGQGWALSGTKLLVRAAGRADAVVVSASTAEGPAVFLIESRFRLQEQRLSDGDVVGLLEFADTPAVRIGDAASCSRLTDLLQVFACAEQLGVTEGALRLTATYASTREQFNTLIGTFQGVRHRLADGHIDTLCQRLTLWEAAWRVGERLPAASEIATAKLWAADAGHRIAHTTVHVHGGVGIDLDGEAHRYFTAAKRHEFEGGGAGEQARRIGAALAG